MKKIVLLIALVLSGASIKAQTVDVYNNGSLVNSYTNGGYNNYKVVLRESTTSPDGSFPGDGAEHTLVDLGLSVKWAACNVGATSPYEAGGYYAWGETTTKTVYNSSTNTYCSCSDGADYCLNAAHFTKYNSTDSLTVLEAADDAATVNWGEGFRMPTKAEVEELKENCTWTWDSTHKGYLVTASNGNSIFLPAAGFYEGQTLTNQGTYGCYWFSTIYSSDASSGYGLFFGSGYSNIYGNSRCYGRSIRAVGN